MSRLRPWLALSLLLLIPACSRGPGGEASSVSAEGRAGPGGVVAPLVWEFAYDREGKLVRTSRPGRNGASVSVTRDPEARVRKMVKRLSDGTEVVYEFDRFGRRTAMTDGGKTATFDYDGFGRLASVRREGSPTVAYTYDTLNRPATVKVGEKYRVSFRYDYLGRIERLDTPAGRIDFEHKPDQGLVTRRLPNGTRSIWKFGPDGKLKTLSHLDRDDRDLLRFEYAYRPDGLVRQVREISTRGERAVSYTYDNVQRLVSVEDSKLGKTAYRYDAFGNRIEETVADKSPVTSEFDWTGALQRHSGQACEHDQAGNLSRYTGSLGQMTLTYTSDDQIASVKTVRGEVRYRYDGDSNLVSRTEGGRESRYVPDHTSETWQPLMVSDSKGRSTFYIWQGDTPIAAVTDQNTSFFLPDHLGTPRGLVDGEGRLEATLDYTPFGAPQQGAGADSLSPGFAGLFYDPQSELYLTRRRAYDPNLGGFLQRDPLHRTPMGSQKDLSLYAYCGGDPVNFTDREGAQPRTDDTDYRRMEYSTGHASDDAMRSLEYITRMQNTGVTNIQRGPQEIHPANRAMELINHAQELIGLLTGEARGSTARIPSGAAAGLGMAYLLISSNQRFLNPDILDQGQSRMPWRAVVDQAAQQRTMTETRGALDSIRQNQWTHPSPQLRNQVEQNRRGHDDQWKHLPFPPGGGGSGGGIGGNSPFGGSRHGAMLPSNIGGVYLRGAAESLRDLGSLRGIAHDKASGRLVLLSDEKGEVGLPPLRLDDVVTVFREVYERGESPFVSIDPDPADPEGPTMNIRLSEGTVNTYVGWVLFEADRVMKAYSLGRDNVTQEDVVSSIKGYSAVLGDRGGRRPARATTRWERFWIVPSEVRRRSTEGGELAFLDIPLKLMTQSMVMRDGTLHPAPSGVSSPESKAFTQWFTHHYDDLAAEASSSPPAGSGIDQPVKIFAELRRIALVAGIAETLRDRGVPMPAWMRDYRVRPCPFPGTTPAINIERPPWKIYGGVTLTPETTAVHAEVDPKAGVLVPVLRKAIDQKPILTPVAVHEGSARYEAVALPGLETRALGACRLSETDISVPIGGGGEISLTRHYHSFVQPAGEMGDAWSLDLPRLEKQRRLVRKTGDLSEFRIVFELVTPLNSSSAVFSKTALVAEMNAELLVPDAPGEILGLGQAKEPTFGVPTKILLFRDGRRWHFDEDGQLVATVEGPSTVIYHRDATKRIGRIEGRYGSTSTGEIQLTRDTQGRIIWARGSHGGTAEYDYDANGALTRVKCEAGVWGYAYRDRLVSAVTLDERPYRSFHYNGQGALTRESWGDGQAIDYALTHRPEGPEIASARKGRPGAAETARYDSAHRPLSRTYADGTELRWQYHGDGSRETTLSPWRDTSYVLTTSADSRQSAWKLPEGGNVRADYDKAHRLTELWEGGVRTVQQTWHEDGQLAEAITESVIVTPRYRQDRTLSQLVLAEPDVNGGKGQSRVLSYDEAGRLAKVRDNSGSEAAFTYDEHNRPVEWTSGSDRVHFGRDKQGRVTVVESSWGHRESVSYDPNDGRVRSAAVVQDGARAEVAFDRGRPVVVRDFSGGETRITYSSVPGTEDRPETVRTPSGLELRYRYDDQGRVARVSCASVFDYLYEYDGNGRLIRLTLAPAAQG